MDILIVEDADIVGPHLQAMLSGIPDFSVILHSSARMGVIEHVSALRPDVVILNFSRQDAAEIDVLKRIKKCDAVTKVMVFVSYADKCYANRCMRAGADYFFDKVFFDASSQFMRIGAFLRVREVLWKLAHAGVQNDAFNTPIDSWQAARPSWPALAGQGGWVKPVSVSLNAQA